MTCNRCTATLASEETHLVCTQPGHSTPYCGTCCPYGAQH